MKEWKVRQEMYHRLNHEFEDDLNKVEIVISKNIKEDAARHFFEYVNEWIYPSKSYAVAFCYAYWISQDFGDDFWELLKDPMLLAGNDPYYKTIDEDPEVYDYLFDVVDWPIQMQGMVPDIYKYYREEMMLDEEGL
jgi:GR25 family glycosyltransferase involved in LPS biosynthesis